MAEPIIIADTLCNSSSNSPEEASDNESDIGERVTSNDDTPFESEEELEDEIIPCWEKPRGVISYPVSLQLQCLLYIIGHIFNTDDDTDDDNLPINSLGLLPRFIRIKLLHLLPAVDVAKLGDTPVTNGISMDEVWEVIYKERLPLHKKEKIELGIRGKFGTIEDLLEEGIESVTWKEAYFNTVFVFSQLDSTWTYHKFKDEKCHCSDTHRHLLPDLLCGVHIDPENSDLHQCFSEESSFSIHGVCRSSHDCLRLTPLRYYDRFACHCVSPRLIFYETRMSFRDTVNCLANCKVSLKHIIFSGGHCKEISSRLEDAAFMDCLSKLLTSVEAVTIVERDANLSYEMDKLLYKTLKTLLDVIFVHNNCPLKFLKVQSTEFNDVFPLLIETPQCRLKQFELSIIIKNDTLERPPNPASSQASSLTFNTALSHSIISVLEHHQGIHKFVFLINCNSPYQLECNEGIIRCISDLLLRPNFKELVFRNQYHCLQQISFNAVSRLFCNFFSSPYPVSMTLGLNCPQFPPITDSLTVNHDQATNKSLQLIRCHFSSSLSSLLPRNLVLKSIKLDTDDSSTISSFASLESITVDSFSLIIHTLITREIMINMSTLLHIVNTKEWDLSVYFCGSEKDTIDMFISILPKVAHLLRHFRLINNESPFPSNAIAPIIETIFQSANMSSFELSFGLRAIDDDVVKAIHGCWERCSGLKLKKLNFTIFENSAIASSYMESLLDMANEVHIDRF